MTAVPSPIRSWINKQDARTFPDWVAAAMAGKREANGTFLLTTKRGQQRVHVGNMVFDRAGDVYSCHPSEARSLIAELEQAERGSQHLNAADRAAAGGKHPPRAEADVADRRDDTDDISRRIQQQTGGAAAEIVQPLHAKPAARPQKISTAPAKRNPVTTPVKALPPKGSMPSIEWIQLDRLQVDDGYQRSVDTGPSRALIARIGREWDWRLCVPLMVSRRADGLFVIDGQHRLFGARLRKDVPQLPCCISVYETPADEAAMFVAANRERRAMNRLDDFHAARASGNKEAVAVAGMIEAAGFTVSRRTGSGSWAPGEVAFTSAIIKALRRNGAAIAQEALNLMFDAFDGQRLVAGSSVFSATISIITAHPAGFTRERMLAALRHFEMAGWASFLDQSRGGTDRAKQLRDMLMAAYDDAGKAMAA